MAEKTMRVRTLVHAISAVLSIVLVGANALVAQAAESNPIIIGLNADMSKGSAKGGEAIRRGIVLAMNEINAAGGVLGRQFELVVRDHRANPARGVDDMETFATTENLVAVVGGIHTPVALAQMDAIHRNKVIYLGSWAAGTPVVENGHDPNYVFRVSVRDEYAGGFLVDAARKKGYTRLGLLLWRTSWGRSNEKAMKAALAKHGLAPAGVQWFNSGQKDMSWEIDELIAAGSDVIMLVANTGEGVTAVREMAARPSEQKLPIISHWGITSGNFHADAIDVIANIDLTFLQTYSFFDPPFADRADRLFGAYCEAFGPCQSRAAVESPVGTAHAYDLVHLLRLAIEEAGTIDRPRVREAFERLGRHEGLVRVYDPPFTDTRHDALDATDFRLSRYDESGAIIPIVTR